MRKHTIVYLCLSISLLKLIAQDTLYWPGGNICSDANWELIFEDEFEGESIDTSKWHTYGPKWPDNSDRWEFGRTHGKEGQVYLDANVKVKDGILYLVAQPEEVVWYGAKRDYSSGMIYSKSRFMYGRFEIRCKIPKGRGFWPAFWTWGGDEIDIFEFGCQRPRRLHTNIHACYDGRHCRDGQQFRGPDFSKAFHTIAVEWDPYYLRWYVDGELIRTSSALLSLSGKPLQGCELAAGYYLHNPLFPGGKHSLIANLAVGTSTTPFTHAPRARTNWPQSFEIDYIRVFSRGE